MHKSTQKKILRRTIPSLILWLKANFSEKKHPFYEVGGKESWNLFFKKGRIGPETFLIRKKMETFSNDGKISETVVMAVEFKIYTQTDYGPRLN